MMFVTFALGLYFLLHISFPCPLEPGHNGNPDAIVPIMTVP